MKKTLLMAALLLSSAALAAPYVVPANQTTNKPSEVQTGGVIRVSNLADFKTLNPFTTKENPNLTSTGGGILSNGGLLTYNPVTGGFDPYMAESFTQSPDKTTFTLNIRKGMKWSDGKPITVEDWITTYTLERNKDIGSNAFSGWYPGDKPILVTKVDSDTLRVKFPKPDVDALQTLQSFGPQPTHIFMPVFASKGAEGVKAMWSITTDPKEIVVSGSLLLDRYVPGERAILKRNPTYGEWNKDSAGKPLPYLDGVQIIIVPDANAQLAQYLGGNVDIYEPNNRDRLAQVKAATDGKKLDAALIANASARASSDFMVFNMDDASTFKGKLFRNEKFRQAVSMLTNRDAMVDLALGGLGQPTYTATYPVYKDWIYKDADKYKYNVAAATKLLSGLGFKKGSDGVLVDGKGNKLEFTLITNAENTRRQQYANILKDEMTKAGIKVTTSFIAFNQMTSLLDAKAGFKPRDFDAIIIGLVGGSLTFPVSGDNVVKCTTLPDDGNLHMFNQTNKCLFAWETQSVNLYYKGRSEFDEAKRKEIANQIQKIESDYQPYIQLAAQTVHYSWLNKVQGEFQRPQINAINASIVFGPRNLDLTWIKK